MKHSSWLIECFIVRKFFIVLPSCLNFLYNLFYIIYFNNPTKLFSDLAKFLNIKNRFFHVYLSILYIIYNLFCDKKTHFLITNFFLKIYNHNVFSNLMFTSVSLFKSNWIHIESCISENDLANFSQNMRLSIVIKDRNPRETVYVFTSRNMTSTSWRRSMLSVRLISLKKKRK